MTRRKLLPRTIALITPLGLSVWLGACSASGSANTGSTNPPATVKPAATAAVQSALPGAQLTGQPASAVNGGEINITLKNNSFVPDEIRVKAGATVTFVLTNKGTEEHTMEIPDFKVYKKVASGSSARVEWTVPDKKGRWDIGCYLTAPAGVHDGMEAILIIE